jgi:hypothetical protein
MVTVKKRRGFGMTKPLPFFYLRVYISGIMLGKVLI